MVRDAAGFGVKVSKDKGSTTLSRLGLVVGIGDGDVYESDHTTHDEIIEEGLLKELARETLANERALARKDPLIAWAVALQMLAIALELAGVQ
jgi:hypothetical protein